MSLPDIRVAPVITVGEPAAAAPARDVRSAAGCRGPVRCGPSRAQGVDAAVTRLLRRGRATGRLVHVEHLPARAGRPAPWPDWMPPELVDALTRHGVAAPWTHQVAAAELAHDGRHVIIATGAASGKSLGYLMPALSAVLAGGTALYIAPTKALVADHFATVSRLRLPGVHAATVDGDTPTADRQRARTHARYLLTNPDMLHHTLLPQHARWAGFFTRLRYVIIDECHVYRGVFGSHVAQVIRRLRRITAHYGPRGDPVFLLASATVADPRECARLLTGVDAAAVTEDGSPRGPVTLALWEPPRTGITGEQGTPTRRAATVEAAELLAELVGDGVPTVAFVRSRSGAEAVALAAKRLLAQRGRPEAAATVTAYRSGYLPEDRRMVEAGLRSGRIGGLAATTALELGVDVTGLDAVLLAGWPGTRAALWQQVGRAGRRHTAALAVLIARDDPLDTYLVHHPEVLHQPVETTVLDPANPHVLAPHLCAAAAELPLTDRDLALFGPPARRLVDDLGMRGTLRRRPTGWHWTRRGRASSLSGLRGALGSPVTIVEEATGRLVGTVDEPSAHLLTHPGAVYVHQGARYLVAALDLAEGVALVRPGDPGYVTSARRVTEIEVAGAARQRTCGRGEVWVGDVRVTRRVVSFVRRHVESGRPLDETPLDLPPVILRTRAVWWTVSDAQRATLTRAGVEPTGAVHAAEHAAIGLLPLIADCDQRDVGGAFADRHPATGWLTVFVYDSHEGGAGFAERGFTEAERWLTAARHAITACGCASGCPSCIQSPTCGTANTPLSKAGAVVLLDGLLTATHPAL